MGDNQIDEHFKLSQDEETRRTLAEEEVGRVRGQLEDTEAVHVWNGHRMSEVS